MDGELIGCLARLLWLPYQIGRAISERSMVGESEMNRAAGRLWRNLAIIGTILLMVAVAVGIALMMK
jgi:hypothetical protein